MKKQAKQIIQSWVQALLVAALFLAISVNSSQAQVPANFTYQGILKDINGAVLTGSYNLLFKIYESETGGTPIWEENHTDIDVQNGIFNVILGNMSNIAFDQQYYLGITINGGQELTPRTKLTAVPYSLTTKKLPDNIVTTNKIINGAVTPEKVNTTDASPGQALIFDGSDLIWQTASNGFTLPYSGTYAGDSSAFAINYNGNGGSGMDIYSSSPGPALSATNALDQGGPAASFQITNPNSFGDVISVKNLGAGRAASFLGDVQIDGDLSVTGSNNLGLTLPYFGTYSGDSSAFEINYSGVGGSGMVIYSSSPGNALSVTNALDQGGAAADFQITNSDNFADVIVVKNSGSGRAAYFLGDVQIDGDQSVSGSKNFVIDHPLDPENKILRHSSVEGPERINIYKGRANLIGGVAIIQLPHYFDALNSPEGREVHLTPVNGWAPLYLDGKITNNQFTVRTTQNGNQSQEFSWVIYGVRNDQYAKDHPLVVEEEKRANHNHFKQGELINPDAVHAKLIRENKNKPGITRRY